MGSAKPAKLLSFSHGSLRSMKIKKVVLSGFKSYKDQPDLEEFHPQANAVSKIFCLIPSWKERGRKIEFLFRYMVVLPIAIKFVLTDIFSYVRNDERQQLIHVRFMT